MKLPEHDPRKLSDIVYLRLDYRAIYELITQRLENFDEVAKWAGAFINENEKGKQGYGIRKTIKG